MGDSHNKNKLTMHRITVKMLYSSQCSPLYLSLFAWLRTLIPNKCSLLSFLWLLLVMSKSIWPLLCPWPSLVFLVKHNKLCNFFLFLLWLATKLPLRECSDLITVKTLFFKVSIQKDPLNYSIIWKVFSFDLKKLQTQCGTTEIFLRS